MNFNESQHPSTTTVAARPYEDWYECWQQPGGVEVRDLERPAATAASMTPARRDVVGSCAR